MAKKRDAAAARASARRRRIFLGLCALGLLLSADLLRLHVKVHTEPGYESYCALGQGIDCETVAASDLSILLGLPLAFWGLVAYGVLGLLALRGLGRRLPARSWPYGILTPLSAAASLAGVALYVLSHVVIESVCIVCIATYGVNFALLFVAWKELRGLGLGPGAALSSELRLAGRKPGLILGYAALALAVLGGGRLAMPAYWQVETSSGPEGLAVGRTWDGHPWIGAAKPTLEVVEFSDYQCPHCRRAHTEMRDRVRLHPDELRLVHRNYPLDQACNPAVTQPFHKFACLYARMAHCAGEQGRFWEANDYLFANAQGSTAVTFADLAAASGVDAVALEECTRQDGASRSVAADMAAGQRLGIRGTPMFVVDGETYRGGVPADVLDAALSGGD